MPSPAITVNPLFNIKNIYGASPACGGGGVGDNPTLRPSEALCAKEGSPTVGGAQWDKFMSGDTAKITSYLLKVN
ncbi:MAG: hypothetical protein A3E37_02410 [Candidatus Andersenbacteria bacterium RIFCSPHIGHO2_12_FULL_46_9]|nr:MAG: hypothetical protein A3E37_02410 [Candidatus Andersenbacteria bacterium RIFCSPHIGHO2_12_FULL_46_9]